MLILKRKVGQSFLISGNILVKLLGTSRGVAIIGIDAPRAVPVLREEIVDKDRSICPRCKNEIDPDTCWCGDLMKVHGAYDGHLPVPMGCDCGRVKLEDIEPDGNKWPEDGV